MSKWRECKLNEICDVRDGTHDSPKQVDKGKPLITSRHIKNGKIDLENAYNISLEDYDQVNKRSKVDKYDILFSMIGTIGETTLIDFTPGFAIKNVGLIKTNKNKDLAYWIYYYLKSIESLAEIDALTKGSTQQYISLGDLRSFPILLPPLPEQKAIAAVLTSLDDKIDLLHRQNKTLEAMAEALFRQWFIEEADEGWEEKVITDLFEIRDGTHDSPKQNAIGYPLITSKHILNNRIDIENTYLISADDFKKINQRSKVDTNDLLFSMIGTIGLIYLEKSSTINYAIKNIGLFKTSQNVKWMYYTYLWLKSYYGQEFIHEQCSGSTQEYISLGSLRNIRFYCPKLNLLDKFNDIIEANFDKIKANQTMIDNLEKLRDTLLPKLMRGEVRVTV